MRTSRVRWTVVLLLVGLVGAMPSAWAAQFTADFVTTTNKKTTATGTLRVQGQNIRQEKIIGERLSVMILNWEHKMLWFLDPPVKTYWEQRLSDSSFATRLDALKGTTPAGLGADLKRLGFKTKKRGTENVRGYPCQKTVIQGDGLKTTIWFSKDLDWPLRTETTITAGKKTTTYRTDYRNISRRKVPASQFDVPAGYRRIPPPLSET